MSKTRVVVSAPQWITGIPKKQGRRNWDSN